MKTVPLYGKIAAGRVALVDDEDYDFVMQHRWSAWMHVGRTGQPGVTYAMKYIKRDGRGTTTRMHQMLTGWAITDHIDRDGLNNQRCNLREATQRQNSLNSRPASGSASQYKGVHLSKQAATRPRPWAAHIRAEGANYELGFYEKEIDAAHAYDAAARNLFGEFAYLNFPELHEPPDRSEKFAKKPEVEDSVIVTLRADGLRWKDVAARVGMSPTGVRMRWHIAISGVRPDRPNRRGWK